jgi:hypothetical protein
MSDVEIIQSAKLTESGQTEVCPEAHDSSGIDADNEIYKDHIPVTDTGKGSV